MDATTEWCSGALDVATEWWSGFEEWGRASVNEVADNLPEILETSTSSGLTTAGCAVMFGGGPAALMGIAAFGLTFAVECFMVILD